MRGSSCVSLSEQARFTGAGIATIRGRSPRISKPSNTRISIRSRAPGRGGPSREPNPERAALRARPLDGIGRSNLVLGGDASNGRLLSRRGVEHESPRATAALADGVELIGDFEDSGFKEAPHLARRADGQVIMLTRLLFLVAAAADGVRRPAEIAEFVTGRFGRRISADNVDFLVEQRLRPLGVLARPTARRRASEARPAACATAPIGRSPERPQRKLAGLFTWLHRPPLVAAVLRRSCCDACSSERRPRSGVPIRPL